MNPEDQKQNDELLIIELDQRLEFGVAALDSDLETDDNTNCTNSSGCTATNWVNCTNTTGCS